MIRVLLTIIYLNIVNVALDDSAEEADSLLEIAKEIAAKYSQERLFDIETRHSLSYYNRGDFDRFLEGYKAYKEGLAKGYSSVHGRSMEVYYLACTGEVDKAVAMARRNLAMKVLMSSPCSTSVQADGKMPIRH